MESKPSSASKEERSPRNEGPAKETSTEEPSKGGADVSRDEAKIQADLDELAKWRSANTAKRPTTALPTEGLYYHYPPVNNRSTFHVVPYVPQPNLSNERKESGRKKTLTYSSNMIEDQRRNSKDENKENQEVKPEETSDKGHDELVEVIRAAGMPTTPKRKDDLVVEEPCTTYLDLGLQKHYPGRYYYPSQFMLG